MAEQRPDRFMAPGHTEFWDWCAKRELRVQKCSACGHLSWPAVAACESCGGTDLPWTPLSGKGKVVSWCTFERPYYAGTLPVPWDTILVELEEGPLFVSNPHGFANAEASAGMTVAVHFLSCVDSAGEFNLPVFAPA